jgi:hypothetical protein
LFLLLAHNESVSNNPFVSRFVSGVFVSGLPGEFAVV